MPYIIAALIAAVDLWAYHNPDHTGEPYAAEVRAEWLPGLQ